MSVSDPSLGSAERLFAAGQPAQAEQVCQLLLRKNPRSTPAMYLLAVIQCQGGRLAEGEAWTRKALNLKPRDPDLLRLRGEALHALGRYAEASEVLRGLTEIVPGEGETWRRLALALHAGGHGEEAISAVMQAIRLDAEDFRAWLEVGDFFLDQGRPDKALIAYGRVLEIQPRLVVAQVNRGIALKEIGRFDEALAAFEAALRLDPNEVNALNNRGMALQQLDRLEEALSAYDAALRVDPNHATVHYNRGAVLLELGRPKDAVAACDAAVRLCPDHAEARYCRSRALLLMGEFQEGWAEYEWRRGIPALRKIWSGVTRPFWRGESLDGRNLLLNAEQGFGDVLQFSRYVPLIAAMGGRVSFRVYPPLVRLIRRSMGEAVDVVRSDAPKPAADFELMLMSAPVVLANRIEGIPARIPYLSAFPDEVEAWRNTLAGLSGLRVGLVWSGGRDTSLSDMARTYRARNLPTRMLSMLGGIPGITWVSLQKGVPAEELAWISPELGLFDATEALGDFADTAALIENLDLVVSVDTAAAHLAAALGKPVWILSRFNGCWRWLLDRTDSPWYPTVRLYRQKAPHAWDEVLARVASDLRDLRDSTCPGDRRAR